MDTSSLNQSNRIKRYAALLKEGKGSRSKFRSLILSSRRSIKMQKEWYELADFGPRQLKALLTLRHRTTALWACGVNFRLSNPDMRRVIMDCVSNPKPVRQAGLIKLASYFGWGSIKDLVARIVALDAKAPTDPVEIKKLRKVTEEEARRSSDHFEVMQCYYKVAANQEKPEVLRNLIVRSTRKISYPEYVYDAAKFGASTLKTLLTVRSMDILDWAQLRAFDIDRKDMREALKKCLKDPHAQLKRGLNKFIKVMGYQTKAHLLAKLEFFENEKVPTKSVPVVDKEIHDAVSVSAKPSPVIEEEIITDEGFLLSPGNRLIFSVNAKGEARVNVVEAPK